MIAKLTWFTVLRILIAGILLFAATLKSNALVVNAETSYATFELPIWLIYQIILLEFTLGIWLLSGIFAYQAWICSILCFSVFAGVSLFSAFSGEKVCGCFGIFSVSPWLVSFLDLSVLSALWFIRPAIESRISQETKRWSGYITPLRSATIFLVFLSGSLIFAYGTVAHNKIELYSEDRLADIQSNDNPLASLGRNLNPFLSEAGLSPPSPVPSAESLEVFFKELAKTRNLPKDVIESLPPQQVLDSLTEERLISPVIFEREDGRPLLLLGVLNDRGKLHYQIMQGPAGPALIDKSSFDSFSLRSAWHVRQQKDRGVTYRFGRSVLLVDKLYHNFGMVRAFDKVVTEFRLTNKGDFPFRIVESPATSCGCTVADFEKNRVLQPGETVPMKIAVKTSTGNVRNSVTAIFADSVTEERAKIVVEVYGSQVESMECSPSELDFGLVRYGEPAVRTMRISEVATDRFQIKKVNIGQLPLQYSLIEKKNPIGLRNYYLEFTLHGDGMPVGSQDDNVTVITDSSLIPEMRVPIKFRIQSKISIHPKALTFGTVEMQSTIEKIAKLVAPASGSCEVSVTDVPAGFSATARETGPGEYEIVVKTNAVKPGPIQGIILVKLSAENWEKTISLNCAAYVKPAKSLSGL